MTLTSDVVEILRRMEADSGYFSRGLAFDAKAWRRLNALRAIDQRAKNNRSKMVRLLIDDEWERRGLTDEDEFAAYTNGDDE